MHQCIKQRATLVQAMKKDMQTNKSFSKTPIKSASKFGTPSSNSAEQQQQSDDDDDDDDENDDSSSFAAAATSSFATPPPKNRSSSFSSPAAAAGSGGGNSVASFANELIAEISKDKEAAKFDGKVSELKSKMRILQQLEEEVSVIPMLEERLRAATKRL